MPAGSRAAGPTPAPALSALRAADRHLSGACRMTKKLNSKDLETFRNSLLRARSLLSGDMNQLQEEALGINGVAPAYETKPGDTSDGYFQEFNLELLERDGSTLREIVDALER